MPRTDRVFLQSHVDGCESCRRALTASKHVYYGAFKLVPAGRAESVAALEQVTREAEAFAEPELITFAESLRRFAARGETKLAFVALMIGLIISLGR
jgi:hypothetical protein